MPLGTLTLHHVSTERYGPLWWMVYLIFVFLLDVSMVSDCIFFSLYLFAVVALYPLERVCKLALHLD